MSSDKFFAGFVAGGMMGAIAGILLAPSSGKDTRDLISEKAQLTKSKVEDSVSEINLKANDIMDDIQKKGDELLEKVQCAINCSKNGSSS